MKSATLRAALAIYGLVGESSLLSARTKMPAPINMTARISKSVESPPNFCAFATGVLARFILAADERDSLLAVEAGAPAVCAAEAATLDIANAAAAALMTSLRNIFFPFTGNGYTASPKQRKL